MGEVDDAFAILGDLKARAQSLGLTVQDADGGGFTGEMTNILAKWALGQHKVVYRMSCRVDAADHAVRFREVVKESSWGLLPPTWTVEKASLKGWERSGRHAEQTPVGGGEVDYRQVREALKAAVEDADWRFHLEGGRMP